MFNFEKLSPPNAALSYTKKKLTSLRRDNRGVAAVEFAVLAPVMIIMYLGLVELSMIINADKVTSHATNITGDLATQVNNMDENDLEEIFTAALATMGIKKQLYGQVGIDIISYKMNGTTIEEIGRARLNGGYTADAFDPNTIGSRLLTATSGAIVTRIQYDYVSPSYEFVNQLTTLKETFILKPRLSADIPFSLDGSVVNYTCTVNSSGYVSCS